MHTAPVLRGQDHGTMCRSILFASLSLFVFSCGQDGARQIASDSGPKPCPAPLEIASNTKEMVQMLIDAMGREQDPLRSGYLNSARADRFGQMAANSSNPDDRAELQFQQCTELIRAGRTSEALPIAESFVAKMDQGLFDLPPGMRGQLLHMLALGYMRLGEQTNCLKNHNNESCILPLSPKAEHRDPNGSRKAIGIYTRILNEDPTDLSAIWLINLAYMTLGEHPGSVPANWLIPREAFGSTSSFPHFPEIAGTLGVDINDLCGGICLEDFNGDGMIDILASSWALNSQLMFFTGSTDGTFTDRTMEAGITGITGALNMNHADYDNDGDADVLMLRGAWRKPGDQPNSLLRNNGDGTFDDVTKSAGLLSFHPTQNAGWSDYDRDGHLDLFIGNEWDSTNFHTSELYHNNGNGTFTEVAKAAGVDVTAFIKACAWGDVDNDGYPDLYVSYLGGNNNLFMNQGAREGWHRALQGHGQAGRCHRSAVQLPLLDVGLRQRWVAGHLRDLLSTASWQQALRPLHCRTVLGPAHHVRNIEAVPQQARRHIRRRDQGSRFGAPHVRHGQQLRRSGQ